MKDLKKLVDSLSGVFYDKKKLRFLILQPGNSYDINNDIITIYTNIIDLSEKDLLPYYTPNSNFHSSLFVKKNIIENYTGSNISTGNKNNIICNIKNIVKIAEIEELNKIYEDTAVKLIDEINDIVLNKPTISKSKKLIIGGGNTPTITICSSLNHYWRGGIGQLVAYITLGSKYNIYISKNWGNPVKFEFSISNEPPQTIYKSDNVYLPSERDQDRVFEIMKDFNNIFRMI